jgi:hypothetical protein
VPRHWGRVFRDFGIGCGPSMAERPLRLEFEGEITTAGKSFTELCNRECRYPIGKDIGGGYRFCGRAAEPRKSYCAEHHALTHRTAPPFDMRNLL